MKPLLLLITLQAGTTPVCSSPAMRSVPYALSFPEPGLDDPAAYEGYRTRFYRDAADNTVQVYIKESEGRVVHLWADAANESVGFTARSAGGEPAVLAWTADGACTASAGADRLFEYTLRAAEPELHVGHFVLGSMRVERDVQYAGRHMEPFGPPFVLPELRALVDTLDRLPDAIRTRHLAHLAAPTMERLRTRLAPAITLTVRGAERIARVEQPAFDGRNRLILELAVPAATAGIEQDGHTVRVRSLGGRPLEVTIRLTTDAPALTPLPRSEIFNGEFFAFLDSARARHDRALAEGGGDAATDPDVQRYRRLERQVRGFELVASREKLMAGLPNYATYFGRDILVTALLMQPVWADGMNEHVLAAVLSKLAADGQVSHEEALGGQAIREHAAEYVARVDEWRRAAAAGRAGEAGRSLERAEAILSDMQRVRENYAMVDDEFQLPILAARYLSDADVTPDRKRAFLDRVGPRGGAPNLTLLLRNLMLVADMTAPYAREPAVGNLIAFAEREPGRYHAASWRDSGAGYGNGRYAMDVNTIWVPQALAATATLLRALETLGYDAAALERAEPRLRGSVLGGYVLAADELSRAIEIWKGATGHFTVRLTAAEARDRIARRLAALPPAEASYWRGVLRGDAVPEDGIAFPALSLRADGQPVAVLSTDLGMRWFLEDITAGVLQDPARIPDALGELSVTLRPYPVGLLVAGLGPLVANDAYATTEVWEGFERDDYHSPRVVWGREVNLLLLGLMRQIAAAYDPAGRLRDERVAPYVAALDDARRTIREAVEASGLQHNELWSYRIDGDRLVPVRWGRSTDVQLWNLTNLVVEFLLARDG